MTRPDLSESTPLILCCVAFVLVCVTWIVLAPAHNRPACVKGSIAALATDCVR
jgi:hypothetical protein